MTVEKATATAQRDGFSVTITTAAPNSRAIPPGTVFAQTPSAGSSARPGSGVILYASSAT
jgi:beta-lactam-binding protein with PASTA domain